VGWNSFSSGPLLAEKTVGQPWGAARSLAAGGALPLLLSLAGDSDGSAAAVSAANSRSGTGVDLLLDRRAPDTGVWTTVAQPLAVRPVFTSSVPLVRLAPLDVGGGWADAAWLEFTTGTPGSSPVLRVRAARQPATP
jgi:hypothetical protein